MTNLVAIATIALSTNAVESLHPSGNEKVRVETVVALVTVPGWTTNSVNVSTNVTRFVWATAPLKPERKPLEHPDLPPLPK